MIYHQRYGGVFEANLPGKHRLGHAGHAHDVGAIALEAVDFSRGLQARPLGGGIYASVGHLLARLLCRLQALRAQRLRVRERKVDVLHAAVRECKKSGGAAVRIVDDLVGKHQRARPQVAAYAADRRKRNHVTRALRMQRPDIGAVVDLVRRNRMAVAVPREEHHRVSAENAEGQCTRRLAVRCAHHFAPHRGKPPNLCETTAADECEHGNQASGSGTRDSACSA